MTTSVSDYPLELISQILLRLPVKSLLKFKRVCREWRNIINSKSFVNMHLTRNEKNPDCLIIVSDWISCVFHSIDLKFYEEAVKVDVRPWWPKEYLNEYTGVRIRGSCNGLLCLSSLRENIALWNPSTKKHLMLPPLSLDDDLQLADEDSAYGSALGFGFDPAVGDYKVVSILNFYSLDEGCFRLLGTEVKVFSLRSNLWGRVYGLPEQLFTCSEGVLIRESLYWLLDDRMTYNCTSILAFDLKTNELRILSLPSYTKGSSRMDLTIQAIEGCLSITFFREDLGFEVWVMDDQETEGSWTKLNSIRYDFDRVYPVQYQKDVGMLLVARKNGINLVWYDFETKAAKEVPIRGLPKNCFENVLLSESLVSLDADEL